MARGYQRLSPQAIDEVWVRLRAGHAAKPAARQLGLPTSTVRTYLLRCGGIRPVPRRRTEGRLSLEEREEISRRVAAGLSLRAIAAQLGRAPSTVSREVAANGGRRQYRAHGSDRQAWSRATRPKACKLATNPALRAIVVEKLRVKGQGLKASRLKSRTSYRVLVLPEWCLAMLRARRVRLGAFDGPVFADSKGGYRDRNNVGRAFREVRAGTDFDWV